MIIVFGLKRSIRLRMLVRLFRARLVSLNVVVIRVLRLVIRVFGLI